MRTLITGVSGFVASSLAVHLKEKGPVVGLMRDINHKFKPEYLEGITIIRGDILDLELLKRIISDYEISTIYHLAAQSIVKIAKNFWEKTYNSVGKKIAFMDGKPIAFMAHSNSYDGDLWWDLQDSPSNNLPICFL